MKICDVPGCVEVTVNVPGKEADDVYVIGAHVHPDTGEDDCPCCNSPLNLLAHAFVSVFEGIRCAHEDEEEDGW